jgi:hypothetical protein
VVKVVVKSFKLRYFLTHKRRAGKDGRITRRKSCFGHRWRLGNRPRYVHPAGQAGRQSDERIAVQSYADIARWLGEDDPTTHRLIVEILKSEEEHAEKLANMLTKVAN